MLPKSRLRGCHSALDELLQSADTLTAAFSKREAPTLADEAALCLAISAIRCGASVSLLARAGDGHYIGAAASARTALETGLVSAWLALPDDPDTRTGRWAGYKKAEERLYMAFSGECARWLPDAADGFARLAKQAREGREAVLAERPSVVIVDRPSIHSMVQELELPEIYSAYRVLSQPIHAEPESLHLVRRVRRSDSSAVRAGREEKSAQAQIVYGSFISDEQWAMVFRATGWAIFTGIHRVSKRLSANREAVETLRKNLRSLLDVIRTDLMRGV